MNVFIVETMSTRVDAEREKSRTLQTHATIQYEGAERRPLAVYLASDNALLTDCSDNTRVEHAASRVWKVPCTTSCQRARSNKNL